jgi:hypothetical protein
MLLGWSFQMKKGAMLATLIFRLGQGILNSCQGKIGVGDFPLVRRESLLVGGKLLCRCGVPEAGGDILSSDWHSFFCSWLRPWGVPGLTSWSLGWATHPVSETSLVLHDLMVYRLVNLIISGWYSASATRERGGTVVTLIAIKA